MARAYISLYSSRFDYVKNTLRCAWLHITKMIRLRICQFQCWNDLQVEIPIGSITLIKGGSGAGKTTLLLAIAWCLYGKVRGVHPTGNDKAKTRVTIEVPYTICGKSGSLFIDRQKNPKRLIVSHAGDSYEDAVAQIMINEHFGKYEVWAASCYIEAGERNNFLKGSNTSKMEFLNTIAFHEEDPTTYIERIDAELTRLEAHYKIKSDMFAANINSFTAAIQGVDFSQALSPEQKSAISQNILSSSARSKELSSIKMQRDVNLGMLANLERELRSAEGKTFIIPEPDASLNLGAPSNETINELLNEIMQVLPLLQRRDDLVREIQRIDAELAKYAVHAETYTAQQLQAAIQHEAEYRNQVQAAASAAIPYTLAAIEGKISEYQGLLASQERLRLEQNLQVQSAELQRLELEYQKPVPALSVPEIAMHNIPQPDYSVYDTQNLVAEHTQLSQKHGELQAHIIHLQKSQDVMECPECHVPLRYQNTALVRSTDALISRDDITRTHSELTVVVSKTRDIQTLITQKRAAETQSRMQYEQAVQAEHRRVEALKAQHKQLEIQHERYIVEREHLAHKIKALESSIREIQANVAVLAPALAHARILQPQELQSVHAALARLQNIKILELPSVSSAVIQAALYRQDLVSKREHARVNYENHVLQIPEKHRSAEVGALQNVAQRVKAYWDIVKAVTAEQQRNQHMQSTLKSQIADLQSKIVADPSAEIDMLTMLIRSAEAQLEAGNKVNALLTRHAEIQKERDDVVKLNAELSDLQSLRQIAVQTECMYLQQIVDSINASIENVCTTLFDRDISIMLSLFKELKTTKTLKPMANFVINYQGGVYDSVNDISRGEGDRMSLALTIALNKLSGCPILILDEPFAFLDLNMKDAAVRTIREHITNTVLICMHGGVEGIFDHVIDVDAIRETAPASLSA